MGINIESDSDSERVFILAPQGRDAQVAAGILREDKLTAALCLDLRELAHKISDGAGLAVMTDDVIRDTDITVLVDWIRSQEPWSDFPFVVLTERGAGLERNSVAQRQTEALGNVIFLERPFHPTTFVSVVRTALRGRRRQYEARRSLEALHESEAHARHAEAGVRSLNETLEARVKERTAELWLPPTATLSRKSRSASGSNRRYGRCRD
jgi:DNA-binding NtrC family response regulator